MNPSDVSRLAEAMRAAELERKAWNSGRLAFREKGEIAMNPNPPGSPDHRLWSDGFMFERGRSAAAPRPAGQAAG